MENAKSDFQTDVIAASKQKPVVVDFWAEWCAPCRMLAPVLEKLATEADGNWKLVKVNTDEQPQISAEYGIRGIPAVKMFYDGEVIAEFTGALPEVQVRRWLQDNIPTESKKFVAEAQAAREAGDLERAKELLEQAVAADATNFDARVPLARMLFESEPERALDLVRELPEEHPLRSDAEAIRTLAMLMNNYDSIAAKASNSQAWQRYLAGIQALQKRNYDEALQQWIEAIIADKTINDDGPRKACVALFLLLGHDHELTRKHHRAFTSALF